MDRAASGEQISLLHSFSPSFSGVPKVLQSSFHLPLALVCVPSPPAKTSKFKITVETNQAPVQLSSIFSGKPSLGLV